MEKNIELLLSKLDEKLEKQTELITYSVTKSVMEALDEKMKAVTEENNKLKNKISELELKLKRTELEKRKSNLVFFGVEEKIKFEAELVDFIKEIIVGMGVRMDSQEISKVYRIGQKIENKNRPVVVTITTQWKKHLILKNKPKLPQGINIKEDYPKEILYRRKQLQPQLEEENKKGNIAYLKYDRLIVKKPIENREKRKRDTSDSPKALTQKKANRKDTLNNPSPQSTLPKAYGLPPRLVPAEDLDHHPLTRNNNNNNNNSRNRNKLYLATLNTRTLRTAESLSELEEALKDLNWNLIGISEMRRVGEYIDEHRDFVIFNKGDIEGQRGVGFIVKKHLKEHILEFIGINDRIAILHMRLSSLNKTWSIIQAYAPTEQADELQHKSFYNDLSQITNNYSRNIIILMGDFNAQVGIKQCEEEYVLGSFGYGKRSKNGQRLVDFLLEHNLTLLNSTFKKNKNKKWTWISPGGNYRTEIDYIITSHPRLFTNTEVITKLNFNTDHRMVRATIKTIPPKLSRKFTIPSTLPTYCIKCNETTRNSLSKLSRELLETDEIDVGASYNKLQNEIICQNNQKLLQYKYDLSDSTLQLINKRKSLFNYKTRKQNNQIISDLSKKIREGIRKDRKLKRLQTLEKHITRTGGTRKALKELRESNPWIPKLKNNQKNVTGRKNINKIATKFYCNLYSNQDTTINVNVSRASLNGDPPLLNPEPEILHSETRKAILSQKLDKAPGPDKITNEVLKGTLEELVPILTKIFNGILRSGYIPEQWEISHIILIHKKGQKDDIGNYRPISLTSNIYKIFSKIILDRISSTLDENQPKEQAGFRKNYSTIDHIHTVKQVMEKYNEYNKPLYMAFIDYSKAFDSISHIAIWESLQNQGIPAVYINIIKKIYSNSKARVQLETLGEIFQIKRGVRQGDPLSPKLFSAVLETIFRKLIWDQYGLRIDGQKLNHLRFADDIVLFEEHPENLEKMLEDLINESEEVGLSLNINKTKLLTNSVKYEIKSNNVPVEYVEEYIYLGQIISHTDITTKEVKRRIANGWKRYWSLKEIMKSTDLNTSIKRKVFNTCVLPCITYGCETWSLTKHHRNMLEHCQRSMERSLIGIKKQDKRRNTFIRSKTKVTDVLTRIDNLKWRWTGHMLRSTQEKWSKIVTDWYPRDGKRKRGRQCKRWEDELKLTAGPNWRRVARDRAQWKSLEEAFANRHTELRDIL
ncbi:uncharacterized protein LOC115443910 [Manduca sexta]|uniref:uncharacterized protein LOC115443910 n=1 Tax=Manduca sexta TaxID=7130 RepID=UPI00188E60CB|nr:uncharacterized protein LOC115443910 [Manduca sexta]